ncbi:MAG TPA: methyl-accepting chemotaxis protein [Ramlibacter sp.]|nr:methyl-accepting chemotaxis protein [Ramlibacter sp.]
MKLNLKIRTKLVIAFAGVLALTGLFAGVAAWEMSELTTLQQQTQGKVAILARANNAMWELRFHLAQYVLYPDAPNRQAINQAGPKQLAIVEDNFKAFAAMEGLTPAEVQAHKQMVAAYLNYKEKRPGWFDLVDKGKLEEASVYRATQTNPAAAQTVKALGDLLDLTSKTDAARREAQQKTGDALLMIAAFVMLAVTGTAAYFLYRDVSRPLARLQDAIDKVSAGDYQARALLQTDDELGQLGKNFDRLLDERIAAQLKAEDENNRLNNSVISVLQSVNQLSQRDLTVRAPVTEDVMGTVADSINALTEETAKVLQGVNTIAGQVAQASGKVQAQAALVSRTAEDERSSVSEMIESLTDATQTMNRISALAEQSNVSAEQATQATDAALETVNGTVKGMESIRETISETEKRIKRLGERSQEISGIVNLINTISERTHVLALNASMQAAVAGEAGRGFAVVAEEVQRLAESSRNATQQIATLVSNIQLETNETISTVNRTIGQVVQGSEQAQKAGDQMRRTQEITGQLVAQVKRISDASDQQKTVSANLLGSVQRIGESTARTAQQIDAQNVDTASLLQSAQRLVESVNVFKLPLAAA